MQLDSKDTLCLPGLGREGERAFPGLNSFHRSLSQDVGPWTLTSTYLGGEAHRGKGSVTL